MAINWTPIYEQYKGKWVALANDEKTVVASSTSVEQVVKLANARGEKRPILLKVPVKQMTYIGYGNSSHI
jgi:hypothetical protein